MAIDKNTVEHVAHLARIELKNQELEKFSQQLQGILDFIDKLKEIEIKDMPPTSRILPISNVLREDVSKESLIPEKALLNSPNKQAGFFAVPKVIE